MATSEELLSAERAGYRCGALGADKENCHFAYFSKPDLTAAWEKGKAKGDDVAKKCAALIAAEMP